MSLTVTLNQYAAGGVANQLASRVGLTGPTAMQQYYNPGGAWGELCTAGGPTAAGTTYNQYATGGGPVQQFVAVAIGPTGATGPN